MSKLVQRSPLRHLRWVLLALVVLATPKLAHAIGATRIHNGGGNAVLVIGADGNIYRAYSGTNLGKVYPDTPAVDIAALRHIYVLAWGYSSGYLLWRCNLDLSGCDWETYFNARNQQFGVRLGLIGGGADDDIPVIATADSHVYQWQNSNWVEVRNARAADLDVRFSPVEGNLYFVSPGGQAYRYNENQTFTTIGGSTFSKEVCHPGANFSFDNPQVLLLGRDNRLYRWDINSNRSVGRFSVSPVYSFDQDPYGYPYVLYGSCSGGGSKIGYTTDYGSVSPVGPNGGCLN